MSAIVFNSNEIKMFPSQTRSDQYDRKARFATDTNIANIGMSLTNKQGFVIRGCVVDANGANLTRQGSDTFHSIWLGGNVFNINRATIELPDKRTTDNSMLISGDVAAFHIKWMNGTNALPSGQIGVIGQLKNGVGESTGKYGGLELVAMNPNQMVGEGEFYAPVATYDGTKWVAHETAMHKYEAKDITVRPSETPTAPSTGAEGEQSLEQFLEFNTIIDDGGLVAESGKQLNRLQLKRASHADIVNSSSVNLSEGQTVIDKDRNYLLRGKNGLPKEYKPFVTNEVLGYANELSPDGNTYTASASPTGQFRLYGANTEVRLDVAQGTPWKIRSGTEEDVVADNVEINPTITLKRSKLILKKGLEVTGAPDFTIVNSAFNKNYNESTENVKKDGEVSYGTLDLIAKADHVHPLNVDSAAPEELKVGGKAEVGTEPTYARRDHKHKMPGEALATSETDGSAGFMSVADKWKLKNLIENAVPDTRKVAGKALSGDISLENFILKLNGESQDAYNGSAERVIDITPSGIGAATAAQGATADSAVQSASFAGASFTKTGTALSITQANARTALGLGSAAYTASTAYATANQGAKADSSVQLSGDQNIGGKKKFTTTFVTEFSGEIKAPSFNATSDIRLKDNIFPCQVKDISQVNVKEYDLKGAKGRHIGVIAQELRKQFPELVCEENDKMKTLSVKESKLVYYLMDEVRRLKAELRAKAIIS